MNDSEEVKISDTDDKDDNADDKDHNTDAEDDTDDKDEISNNLLAQIKSRWKKRQENVVIPMLCLLGCFHLCLKSCEMRQRIMM